MSVEKNPFFWKLAKILAGLLAAIFVIFTFSELFALVSEIFASRRPPVVWYLVLLSVVYALLSVISIIFLLRGNSPAGKRLAGKGCFFLLIGGLVGGFLASGVEAVIDQSKINGFLPGVFFPLIGYIFGGVLGLYLARPKNDIVQSEIGPRQKPAWSIMAQNAGAIALVVSIFGCFLTYFGVFVFPCFPSGTASDAGAVRAIGATVFIIWIISFPFAVLLGGVFGYAAFRYLRAREETSKDLFAARISGVLSGLVFLVINFVMWNQLLCVK